MKYYCPYCAMAHSEPNAACCGEVGHVEEKLVFRLKADLTFYAMDIDDAFALISEHFEGLQNKLPPSSDILGGQVHVGPDAA